MPIGQNNQWNDFFNQLIPAVGNFGTGLIAKSGYENAKGRLMDLYNKTLEARTNLLTRDEQLNKTGEITEPLPKVGESPESLYSKMLASVTDDAANLGNMGDAGKNYANSLMTLFSGLQKKEPQYEYKTVNNRLVRINKQTGQPTYLTEEVKKPDEKQILTSKEQFQKNEDGSYSRMFTVYNKSKDKLETQTQPATEQEYNDWMFDKLLTQQQKSDITENRQKNLISFKLDLGLLGKKGSKSGKDEGLTLDNKDILEEIKNVKSKEKISDSLSDEQKERLNEKKNQLINNYFGGDESKWNDFTGKIMNSTEKGAKNIMKKFAPNLQKLKNQSDYIRQTYDEIRRKFEAGEITAKEVKGLFLNFYKSQFKFLLPEARSQIEAYFNQIGIKY
jgi:hypothetical protein